MSWAGMSTGPTATIDYTINATNVSFQGTSSLDVFGSPNYFWTFGDGTNFTGPSISHTYAVDGDYNVHLSVAIGSGHAAADALVQVPSSPPTIASVTDDVPAVVGALSNGQTANDNDLTVKVSLPSGSGVTAASTGDVLQLSDAFSSQVLSTYDLTDTDIANGYATVQTGFLLDGAYELVAQVISDFGTGATSQPSNAFDVTVDATAPDAPILTLGSGVSDGATAAEAEQIPGVVGVSGELGAAIVVTFTHGATVITKNLTGIGIDQAVSLTAGDVTALGDGTITVSATQTDAAGNAQTAPASTTSFVLDTQAPGTVVLALGTGVDGGGATAAEATQASGVVTVQAEAGTTITVNFTGANVVHKVLTATGSAQAVVLDPVDVTFLGDGTITVGAIAQDAAGNSSTPAQAFFTLDTQPPAPGNLVITDRLIDINEVSSVPFQVSGLEVGGSGVATFTDGTHFQTVDIVSGVTSYTVDLTGFGRTVKSSMVVYDGAGNSRSSTGNSTTVATTPDLFLSIAMYNAISPPEWQGNPAYTSVTVKDSAANMATFDFVGLAAKGVTGVASSTGGLNFTVAQYEYLLAKNIAAAPTNKLADAPAAIEAMSGSDFAGMAGKNITQVRSTTGELTVDVDQYTNLGTVKLYSADVDTLKDSAGTLGGLDAATIGLLTAGGIDKMDSTDSVLTLGADQFAALKSVVINPALDLILNGDVGGVVTNDIFTFSKQSFSAADQINGAAGNDTLLLQGNFGSLAFNADTISSIETLRVTGGGGMSYDITENDNNVAFGQNFKVSAAAFTSTDSVFLDGSAETDGTFSFTGGAAGTSTFIGGSGSDLFTGGAGNDNIGYTAASQSTGGVNFDKVAGFDPTQDHFELWKDVTYDGVVTGTLSSATFNTDLGSALSSLQADHAVIFNATSGNMKGYYLVANDETAGYQGLGQELDVKFNNPTATTINAIGQSNFTKFV